MSESFVDETNIHKIHQIRIFPVPESFPSENIILKNSAESFECLNLRRCEKYSRNSSNWNLLNVRIFCKCDNIHKNSPDLNLLNILIFWKCDNIHENSPDLNRLNI